MKASKVLRQKIILRHQDGLTLGIFEFVVWKVPMTKDYTDGTKYRAWLSVEGDTVFGFDNHKPKGPHLHIGDREIGYVYRGLSQLRADIVAMIKKEGFLYEE
jgi:hypothetical protein